MDTMGEKIKRSFVWNLALFTLLVLPGVLGNALDTEQKDDENSQRSDQVAVSLNFGSEFCHIYTAKLNIEKLTLPKDIIDLAVVKEDIDSDAAITYTVIGTSPLCKDCFSFSGKKLQLIKDLTQEIIRSSHAMVVIQGIQNETTSCVVLNIHIDLEYPNPRLAKDFYKTELKSANGTTWTIDPSFGKFTATTSDTKMENNLFNFTLKWDDDFDVSTSFRLSQSQGQETSLELSDEFDIGNLPKDGTISFFIEVSDISDPAKSSRSLMTVNYPTKPDLNTTPSATLTSETAISCKIQEDPSISTGAVVLVLMCILAIALFGWIGYAYLNPNISSGRFLISVICFFSDILYHISFLQNRPGAERMREDGEYIQI
eukprot:GFUD01067518.1.p1 GENE.GFUD01067518.1~~GFUD01067518.1.p1  ORF type:complete len:372 (+),score=64.82 GFUD01067518.1:42-1157(+)